MNLPDVSSSTIADLVSLTGRRAVVTGGGRGLGKAIALRLAEHVCAGLGVPFLLAGIAIGPFLTFFSSFRKHLGTVEKVVGVLLVITGLLFLTGQFTRISYWFLETFPILQSFG